MLKAEAESRIASVKGEHFKNHNTQQQGPQALGSAFSPLKWASTICWYIHQVNRAYKTHRRISQNSKYFAGWIYENCPNKNWDAVYNKTIYMTWITTKGSVRKQRPWRMFNAYLCFKTVKSWKLLKDFFLKCVIFDFIPQGNPLLFP